MSGNKNLLQEATIKRFMKLANVDRLSGEFLKEKYKRKDPGEADEANESFDIDDEFETEVDLFEQEEEEDAPLPPDMEEEPGMEEEPDMEEEPPGGGRMGDAALYENRDAIINEVLKRVAKRLVSARTKSARRRR